MRKNILLLVAAIALCSHDLYLKMDTYFFKPNQEVSLNLYNGTFEKSENIITRDRIIDASIVGHDKRMAINPDQWQDIDSTVTNVTINTGKPGTYVAGVSTKARNISLTAEKFNSYLEHDGVLDMLNYRKENDLMDQDAVESYQKHVKAIYQVGNNTTNDWQTTLGYPIEFVPRTNPYEKYSGEKLEVQLLLDGKPLANQLVYAHSINVESNHTHGTHTHDGSKHMHEHTHATEENLAHSNAHTHTQGQELRTNESGIVTVNLPEDGIYYLRTIYLVNVTDNNELTHTSKWATLTFEVSHKHNSNNHAHDHHDHEDANYSTWIFVLGSLIIVGILFFFFNRKD